MNRKGESIPLSVLFLALGIALFRAAPQFLTVYNDLYPETYHLPLITRIVTGPPPMIWLAFGTLACGSVLTLNANRNCWWQNLVFFLLLVAFSILSITALFVPFIVDVTKAT